MYAIPPKGPHSSRVSVWRKTIESTELKKLDRKPPSLEIIIIGQEIMTLRGGLGVISLRQVT